MYQPSVIGSTLFSQSRNFVRVWVYFLLLVSRGNLFRDTLDQHSAAAPSHRWTHTRHRLSLLLFKFSCTFIIVGTKKWPLWSVMHTKLNRKYLFCAPLFAAPGWCMSDRPVNVNYTSCFSRNENIWVFQAHKCSDSSCLSEHTVALECLWSYIYVQLYISIKLSLSALHISLEGFLLTCLHRIQVDQ